MARGLEEVAHFFFSDRPRSNPSDAQKSGCALALLSLAKELPTSLLTTNLAVEMVRRQKRVLVADAASSSGINIYFSFGMPHSFTPIERFLRTPSPELIRLGPRGIRILDFPLDCGRLLLLRSVGSGRLFHGLVREESRSDVFLINLDRSTSALEQHILCQGAREVLLLIPADLGGLKSGYRFLKSLFRSVRGSPVGVLLTCGSASENPSEGFKWLSEAVSTFLDETLNDYGFLSSDHPAYQSILRGTPLCAMPQKGENALTLASIASRFTEQFPTHGEETAEDHSLFKQLTDPPKEWPTPLCEASLTSREEDYFKGFSG